MIRPYLWSRDLFCTPAAPVPGVNLVVGLYISVLEGLLAETYIENEMK